ncbi:MAG: chemotaxis protein CheW [Planctomycetia bacterium]
MSADFADPGREVAAPMEHCWRHVGVGGDRSCPELAAFIHCRNCPVVAAAARRFFDRPAPAGYLESWGETLAQPIVTVDGDARGVLIFRLCDEWMALPTSILAEVTTLRRAHRVPHRSGAVLAGIVNIRGQLQLCIRLPRLLGLDPPPEETASAAHAARLLVVEHPGEHGPRRWVFEVDEVAGVHRVHRQALAIPPSTVSHAAKRATAGLFAWQDKTVALLDEARLLDGLARLVSA